MSEPLDQQAKSIHIAGGSIVEGGVNTGGGDFIGRDQHIQGDLVRGNKVVTIQQTLSEVDLRDQANLRTLRQMVKKFWIEGVLEHSLNHEAAIRLHITDRSSLVENRPWQLMPHQPTELAPLLPSDTHIIDVFDQMNQRLLILGEPGAGKTTLLLELASALLMRADETPGYPSPVVFNLSSWAQRQASIAEWLVDELGTRYTIPKKVAQTWVVQDKLLPLLDGLDEVQPDQRAACAEAINQFQQEHLVPLVVCCRVTEYEQLTVRLKLQGAVLLQPLTVEQIDAYLDKADPPLVALRSILQQDPELQVLAQSPLQLSIMVLAYQDVTPADLSLTNPTQTRHQHLFNTYIQRMFGRREGTTIYSSLKTIRWLQHLAIYLVQFGQTIFLIERMQPSWLQGNPQKPSLLPLIMVLSGPLYGLIYGLVVGLVVGLAFGLLDGLSNGQAIERLAGRVVGLLDGLIIGLLVGLSNGLFVGLVFGLVGALSDGLSGSFRKIIPIEQSSILSRKLKSSLYAILLWGINGWLVGGLVGGLSGGFSGGLICGLSGALLGIFREIEPIKRLNWSWSRIKSNLYFGLLVGLFFLLSSILLDSLIIRLSGGLFVWVVVGLVVGLSGGLSGGLIFQTSTGTDITIIRETQKPNQGIRLSLRYSLVTSLVFGLLFGLVGALSGWLSVGQFVGLVFGLVGALSGGADVVMKHCILRLVLWWKGYIPWNYARFLDYATALIFLHKVGGGYIFVHRLLLEHFANLTEDDIKRLSS